MKASIVFSLILLITFFSGCKSSDGYKPNAGGKAGELLVVINDTWKDKDAGKTLLEILQQPYMGLPQPEPMFDVSTISYEGLNDFMKTYRNLLMVKISPKVEADTVLYYKDVWAKEQALIKINAKNEKEFLKLLKRHEIRILSFFNKAERERSMKYYRKYINKEFSDKIRAKYGVFVTIPNSFTRINEKKDFIWMNAGSPAASEGIMVYSFPYVGEGTFSKEYLLNKRDSILKKNVPGPTEGSYMSTEMEFPPIYKTTRINGEKVVEMRGLWKVVGDMMGGPWILHAHLDKEHNRVIVLDAYVYSPEKNDKRNKIRQLEAVLYSYKKVDKNTDKK
ncbi:MAG: DUF4837 family protein [Chlorobi bacterium]|nr:DUF4837 family protein [Chlorobiota bacterium]